MLRPKIEKVTVNISLGQSGEPLERASTVLKQLTGQQPCKRKAKKTIRTFGIRKGEPIACLVTLRKEKATKFLKTVLGAVENRIPKASFDRYGNFAFGIKEHTEIPGTRYSPELGIFGMDVAVSLGRLGYRVKRRRIAKTKIGQNHLLTPEDAMLYLQDTFNVEIT